MKKTTKGIVIIATRHAYYGNYAANLAASLKTSAPDIPICLLHDDRGIAHLNEQKKKLFDFFVTLPQIAYTNKGRPDYLKIKTTLYNFTPFDETIFIDADVLWLPRKSVSIMFDLLKDTEFTMANRGSTRIKDAKNGYITWANPEDIMREYALNDDARLYNLSSEFMYFKKTKDVKKLFAQAQKNYSDLKVRYVLFGSDIPDELPFCIAMMQTGIYPHKTPFLPFYWEQFQRENLKPSIMYENYFAYSCGGCIQDQNVIKFYNNLAQYYCNKLGCGIYFPLMSKKRWLPERTHI